MKVILLDTTHKHLINELNKKNVICHEEYSKSKDQIEKIIDQYDGIVIRSRFKIDKKFIRKAKNLKFIARAGSGLENIDVEFANEKNIKCINAGEGNKQAVAEHALGMILSLVNNIHISNNEIKNGKWKREENRGIELSEKTIGIIGFGNTGGAFVNLLENFNLKILVYDKYKIDYKYKTTLTKIYEEADFISLHIPLNKQNTNYLNEQFIEKMKKPFYLINTSRGKCVNNKALVKALRKNKILGTCLDVLEQEKSSFENIEKNQELDYLMNSRKTILTPHIAGWTKESYFKISKILSKKIISELF